MSALKPKMFLVGRRRWWPQWRAHGSKLWTRWRYPGTRRTLLNLRGRHNAKDLGTELKVLDKRPIAWALGLLVLAVLPPLLGVAMESTNLLAAASVFALYAAINLVWMLVIGTAGIFSLATLAIVGSAAYAGAWLSIEYGLPWWGMVGVGAVTGLLFGVAPAVFASRQDLAQAQGARPQRLVGRHVRLHLGQIEGGRQDVPVLLQHHQGMPAELLRLLAHLGKALHILRVEGHQGLDELLQRRNRLIQLGQAVRGELDGNQILGHGVSPVVEGMGCPGDGRIIRLAGRRDDRGVHVGWVSSKWEIGRASCRERVSSPV